MVKAAYSQGITERALGIWALPQKGYHTIPTEFKIEFY